MEVDLALNAHANARWHHELRKKHLGKLQKTVDANAKAFKAAEKRTNTQLVQVPCLFSCAHIHHRDLLLNVLNALRCLRTASVSSHHAFL